MAVNLNNRTLAACFSDRQLGGTFGTLGLLHDLLAELVVASLPSQTRQRLSHVLPVDFLARDRCPGGRRPSGGKAQRLRIKLQQARLRGRGVAKLETQLHSGGEMGRWAREQ